MQNSLATMPASLPARHPAHFADPESFHRSLAISNRQRLAPSLPTTDWRERLAEESAIRLAEGEWVEVERARIEALASEAPHHPAAFVDWFERLRLDGPGQGDELFPYLAEMASLTEMKWFLEQEMAGEAGFEDLVAITQVRIAATAKLELARNYWDEMGRGDGRAMHGPMLERLGVALAARSTVEDTVWPSLALANLMVALATNRRYAYHSLGALGVIEMTAPGRVSLVDRGLSRLGIAPRARQYFKVHATLDVKHSEAWNREVFCSIVADTPAAARALAEGALLRLSCGARCFAAYRRRFASGFPGAK
jgi:hypothetical protein